MDKKIGKQASSAGGHGTKHDRTDHRDARFLVKNWSCSLAPPQWHQSPATQEQQWQWKRMNKKKNWPNVLPRLVYGVMGIVRMTFLDPYSPTFPIPLA